jgi:hypothetical protein
MHRGVTDTAVTSTNFFEYLCEFEALFENAHVSGAQGKLFDEKTTGRKSHDRAPLTYLILSRRKKTFIKKHLKQVRFTRCFMRHTWFLILQFIKQN